RDGYVLATRHRIQTAAGILKANGDGASIVTKQLIRQGISPQTASDSDLGIGHESTCTWLKVHACAKQSGNSLIPRIARVNASLFREGSNLPPCPWDNRYPLVWQV